MKQLVLSAALALALVACATKPQSVDETLGAAELQVAALETSAAQARTAGVLTQADGAQVLSLGDQALAAIKAARAAEATGDMTTVQGKLAVATSLLLQLSQYLATHGVK